MSDADDDRTIFAYELSDDKATLTLRLTNGVREYTADEVTKLALFFANLRADMSPPVPNESHLDLVPAVECPRYEVLQKIEDGSAQIYLQTPGLFWSFIHLTKEQAERMAETLSPALVVKGNHIAH